MDAQTCRCGFSMSILHGFAPAQAPARATSFDAFVPALAGSQQENSMANRTCLAGLNENFFEDDDVALHAPVERNDAFPMPWFARFAYAGGPLHPCGDSFDLEQR